MAGNECEQISRLHVTFPAGVWGGQWHRIALKMLEMRAGRASGLWQKSSNLSRLASQTLLKLLKESCPLTYPEISLFWIEKNWVTAYRLFIHILVVPGGEATAFLKGGGGVACRVQAGKQLGRGDWANKEAEPDEEVNYCMQREWTHSEELFPWSSWLK